MQKHQKTTKEELLKENKLLRAKIAKLERSKNKNLPKKNTQIDKNELWNSFMNSAHQGFAIVDSNLDFIEVNKAALTIFGLKREDFIGKNITEVSPDVKKSGRYDKYVEVIKSGKSFTIEDLVTHPKLGNVYLNLKAFPIGRCCGIIITDITEPKKSESRLKSAQELGKIGTWNLDIVNDVLEWTEESYKIFGVKQGTPMNLERFLNTVHPDDKDYVAEKWTAGLNGEEYDIEHRLLINGKVKWVREKADVTFDENGSAIKAVGITQDITEKKKAEIELREHENQLGFIYDSAADILYYLKAEGGSQYRFLSVNNAFLKATGLLSDEIVGKPLNEVIPESSLGLVRSNYEKAIREKKIVTWEETSQYPSGLKTGIVSIAPIFDEKGNCTNLVGSVHDITERKLADEKVREKDIQFRKLSSNVPDLIFQFTRRPDGTYCVPIASEGIKNIFGCSPEDVVEDFAPIGRVIYPEDAERVISDIEYSAKHLTYFTCEFRVQIPGKDIQWIYSRSSPEKLEDGSITWYGFNADITLLKQAEEELIKAKEKAEESDRLKSAFLANMSHEIRTPMNGILGFLELLKEQDLTETKKENYINIVNKGGVRLLNTINDIIEVSKIESNNIEIDKERISIKSLLKYYYEFFLLETKSKGLDFKLIKEPKIKNVIIYSDKNKLHSILTNLIKNAIKFTKTGKIELGCEMNKNALKFFVSDTGMGIKKERLKAVFDRFVQADINITKGYEGSGLGLSICKSYVELLGGKIWVESEENKGSTFFFTIPIDNGRDKNEQGGIISEEISIDETKLKSDKKLKILIAEDDQVSSMYLKTLLETIYGEVLQAHTGDETVYLCYNNPDIDIILMDIKMPDISGYDATRKIRKFNKNVHIIAQTAFAFSEDEIKAKQAGCDAYLTKPIKKEVLYDFIEKHLETK